MNDDHIQRLRYFKGQLLTAKDFEEQQEYHRTKLKQLTARFPYGIVKGLTVIYDPREPSDPEPLVIQDGLAVDEKGDSIALSEHRVSLDGFNIKNCYLSIKYSESASCSIQSVCEITPKKNRIKESLETKWDTSPNRTIRDNNNNIIESYITVARLRPKKEPNDDEWKKSQNDRDKKSSESFLILENKNEPGLPTIRLDAGLIGEEQLDISVKGKLVTEGDRHDHTNGSGGAQIPMNGLTDPVQEKINLIPDDLGGRLVTIVSDKTGTHDPDSPQSIECDFNDIKFRIPSVLPTVNQQEFSWSFKTKLLANNGVKYIFTINSTETVGYRIDFAEFNLPAN